tara:strand:+ start:51 stop:1037 length:987 start_codon:yes stop_codon:yes gene_type:complete
MKVPQLTEIWSELEDTKPPEDSSYRLKTIHKYGLMAGISGTDGRRVMVFELPENHKIRYNLLPHWIGLDIKLSSDISGLSQALIFVLVSDEIELFDFLILKLISMLDSISSVEKLEGNILNFLERMDSFFKNYKEGLSETAQQGLYGELFFLINYILKYSETAFGLDYWRGHSRKHQDFCLPGGYIEVKTTAQKEHKTATISNEKQLDERNLSSLYLYVLCVRKLETDGQTLVEIVDQIRSTISSSEGDVLKFNRYLQEAGYFDEHDERYKITHYIKDEDFLFEIRDEFPRIIDLPIGVGLNSYTIALSSCMDYLVENNVTLKKLLKN